MGLGSSAAVVLGESVAGVDCNSAAASCCCRGVEDLSWCSEIVTVSVVVTFSNIFSEDGDNDDDDGTDGVDNLLLEVICLEYGTYSVVVGCSVNMVCSLISIIVVSRKTIVATATLLH